ncbi:TIGR02466 family protein [Luteimonas sp. MJ293]|uniref:TIGR02466 family protein n=1 Tax=Luteimonas sp. MJ146 TaxID=3129240 RepID=UPI0031B9D5BD
MNESSAQVFPIFAVPMLEATLPGAEQINPELRGLFLGLEAEGEMHRDTVARDTLSRVFESNFYLHTRKEPAVASLFGFIDGVLRDLVAGLSGGKVRGDALALEYSMWFHVTRPGGYQGTHNHPNASWSGIYCVDPGDAEQDADSGVVRFRDPRAGADMYKDPANEAMAFPYQVQPVQRVHKAGSLIMFPSYLYHEIFVYRGQRPRIIVAFNAWAVRKPG